MLLLLVGMDSVAIDGDIIVIGAYRMNIDHGRVYVGIIVTSRTAKSKFIRCLEHFPRC